jgi:hypothetical protein
MATEMSDCTENLGRYWDDERRADELYLDRPIYDEEEDDDE